MQMPDTEIEISWKTLESINESIHVAARASDWLDVLEIATKRHAILQDHFRNYPVGPDNAEFYRQRMDRLLHSEAELQKAVRNARKLLMSEGLETQHKQRALGAYLNTAMR